MKYEVTSTKTSSMREAKAVSEAEACALWPSLSIALGRRSAGCGGDPAARSTLAAMIDCEQACECVRESSRTVVVVEISRD
eukprot:6214168-Pleurochrysis_carterae.AAC.1